MQNDREYSELFPVNKGCGMAPIQFSMMMSVMLTDAFQDCDNGFPCRYGYDGELFNIRRLEA